jgi:hypothetical protein
MTPIDTAVHLFTLVTLVLCVRFYRRQNVPGTLGGPICFSKALWLHYTLYTWFLFLPYVLWRWPDAVPGQRAVWMALTGSMWARGVIEIYMLYVSKNWTPVIGISHDVATIVAMVIAWAYAGFTPWGDPVGLLFTASLIFSMVAETHHAASFYALMKGRTKGDEAMWYAHEGDPRFRRIILVTIACNWLLYLALVPMYVRVAGLPAR